MIYSSIQKKLFSQSSSSSYLIPILLLMFSFVIFSFSLEGQSMTLDEFTYFAWGGIYFDLIKEGDLTNPCLYSYKDCELFYVKETGHEINYTPIRNFFVGFGQYLTTGENEGDFYHLSCLRTPGCWDDEYYPTMDEITSGRFLSPIFGSLTIVLAFFIGQTLFNRSVGLFFSLILLFYGLWIMTSRLMMSEVYLYFFIMLSILLLLKSFKKESKHRKLFFISGAISFGIALNIKLVAIELLVPILIFILFYHSFNEKLNFRFFRNKKNLLKITSLILVFFVISAVTFVATFPKYYDPLNEIEKTLNYDYTENIYSSPPSFEKNYLYQTLTTSQVTLFPYLTDSYIHEVFPDQYWQIVSNQGPPANYSTIPLTLFFFIGLIYIIYNIKTGNLKFSEFALLAWFASLFIFSVLTIDYYKIIRLYLPAFFPMILIASYGLWRFINQIQNQKEKIFFFTSFMVAHSLYLIPILNTLYFSPLSFMWSPFPVYSQLSLNDPIVYVSSITFVMIFILIYLRIKTRIPAKTKQVSSSQQN